MIAKQVIVMRKDLNMRKGKMVAQGSHASIAFLTSRIREGISVKLRDLPKPEREWIDGNFTKVCVGVYSLEELKMIHQTAYDAGLVSIMITDSGLTEFNGIPTTTCIAIGPDYADKIDAITGHLELL